jgi:hypothetical protein
MHRYRAPLSEPGTLFAGQCWADCIISMSGFDLRQAQGRQSYESEGAQRLVEMGLATVKDGKIRVPRSTVTTLERLEVERVGQQMASERGLTYFSATPGDHISGRLIGIANLVSGRFAVIDNGLGFQLAPWQPLLEKRIGQHITGLQRDDGGIEWTLGRSRGLSL